MTSGNNYSGEQQSNKIVTATKWSTAAELISKLFLPISSLILARMLAPEEFGIIATITMVLSLSDIIADAGFHKYIIQHQFNNKESLYDCANVAFWTNQGLSLILWIIIVIINEPIAALVGCPGYGVALVIACLNIPLLGFSSIQSGLLKRDLNFKPLFYIRIFSSVVPFVVTVPLAFIFRNFWALIVGTLAKNILTSILLIIYTQWKPRLSYSFVKLKDMLSFSLWSMLETLSVWVNQYVDIFLVGTLLSQYYLGLYKTSLTLVGQCVGIITSIFTPVIFSTLSKFQDSDIEFKRMFFKFQKVIAILVMPIGIIIYAEDQLFTEICLGNQWIEASSFIGVWALTSTISVATVRYCSELYRAKGRPLLCFLVQSTVFVSLVPSIYYSAKVGFQELCLARSGVEGIYIIINIIVCYFVFNITLKDMLKNLRLPIVISIILYLVLLLTNHYISHRLVRIIIITFSSLLYFGIIFCCDKEVKSLLNRHLNKKSKM